MWQRNRHTQIHLEIDNAQIPPPLFLSSPPPSSTLRPLRLCGASPPIAPLKNQQHWGIFKVIVSSTLEVTMHTTFRRDWLSTATTTLTTALVGIGCMTAIAYLQFPQLQQLKERSEVAPVEQLRREAAAESARLALLRQMPSFGYDNFVSNIVFLNFLQYFGDGAAREKTDYRLSPEYFEIIIDRDPYFIPAYHFISTSTSMYAGMPERAVTIAQRGLKSLQPNVPPNSFFAWRLLAIDQLLFLGNPQAARQSFLTAAQWARTSSFPGAASAAKVSEQTATFLARNPNSKTAQMSAWVMVLSSAPDERTQAIAIQRIEALGGKITQNPDGSPKIQFPPQD